MAAAVATALAMPCARSPHSEGPVIEQAVVRSPSLPTNTLVSCRRAITQRFVMTAKSSGSYIVEVCASRSSSSTSSARLGGHNNQYDASAFASPREGEATFRCGLCQCKPGSGIRSSLQGMMDHQPRRHSAPVTDRRLHPIVRVVVAGSSTKSRSSSHVTGRPRIQRPGAVNAVSDTIQQETGFEAMAADTKRRYYMIGGKGGVGKTSLAASLAVKFANSGHPTLVVSTDPAHSLSDSFAQDVSGGMPVVVEGTELPLYGMEIDPEQAREEYRSSTSKDGSSGVKDFMDSMGLGGWIEQLSELKLGELLDTPPPGLDEAVAISKVVQFVQAPEYEKFTRIIFDTAPTGHTLRLLSLPDFLEASIGKILKLKAKVTQATSAVKSLFGQGDGATDTATEKLEALKERMLMVREIFRDKDSTEFVIVTIPTVMAVSESSRLLQSLIKESVPVKRLIINQVLSKSPTDCKFCNIKRKDQLRAIDMVNGDPGLKTLEITEGPLFDMEIRGVPALKFLGDLIWK